MKCMRRTANCTWVDRQRNENNVTDLLKAFLGNGSVNTVNVQQWKMCLSGRILLRVARLGNSAPMKTLARDHVTRSLCGPPYAIIELCFLFVVCAEAI
jgi:hypothetical protein